MRYAEGYLSVSNYIKISHVTCEEKNEVTQGHITVLTATQVGGGDTDTWEDEDVSDIET